MSSPNFAILYVKDPLVSARFYAALLNRDAVEASPGFALFALDNGLMLGLWLHQTVVPKVDVGAGGSELAVAVGSAPEVDDLHRQWVGLGLPILQAPEKMDFGYTFTAADPDGHRLRVFAPAAT